MNFARGTHGHLRALNEVGSTYLLDDNGGRPGQAPIARAHQFNSGAPDDRACWRAPADVQAAVEVRVGHKEAVGVDPGPRPPTPVMEIGAPWLWPPPDRGGGGTRPAP